MSLIMYALMDKRNGRKYQPFYVGIGSVKRPAQHIRAAQSKARHPNPKVQHVMDEHFAEGIVPEIKTLVVCPDREYAWLIERRYIAALGRIDIDEHGILCNLGAGGEDVGSDLPHVKAAKSAATKRLNAKAWSDPETRAARIAAMQGKKKTMSAAALEARRLNAKKGQTPEVSAKKSEAARRRWADPAYKAAMAVKRKKVWQDADMRAAMLAGRSEGIAASWLNPETRQRRIDGIKAAAKRVNDTGA